MYDDHDGTPIVLIIRPAGLRKSREQPEATGFSLLEMVVVLAIIGILIAIQLPNIIGNTDKAKLTAAMTLLSNAVTECALAKTNGATESEMYYSNDKLRDLAPSLYNNPKGYKWENASWAGCNTMFLVPVDKEMEPAVGQGFPVLAAKILPGGRIRKVANYCNPTQGINFVDECASWDSTFNRSTYMTGRDLSTDEWEIKD